MEYKCKVCGGELGWDPSISKLRCKFCDATYDLDEFKDEGLSDQTSAQQAKQPFHVHEDGTVHMGSHHEQASAVMQGFDKATDDSTEIKEDLRVYQCPSCRAEVVTDKNTTATTCVFCNSPLVLQEQMNGTFRPDYVIPFEVDRKKIEELYENYIRNKPFYPEEYSTANVIEKIKGIYLPFWVYDFTTTGDLSATGERTRTWSTPNWIITDHDVFDLYRAGKMNFSGVPVIASNKTPKDAMDALEPFDYSKMKDYNPGYLPGFMAERYDKDVKEASAAALERAGNTFDQQLSQTIGGFSSVAMRGGHMDHVNRSGHYALMPAWMLFMDYKNDEDKLIAINGQTGKIVGNVPVDKHKRNKYFLIRFLLIWIVLALLALVLLL